MSRARCTCSSPNSWEYGPCDYCTDETCHECEHTSGDCPDDCFCDCNENEERLLIKMTIIIDVSKEQADELPTVAGFINGGDVETPRSGIHDAAERIANQTATWCATIWEDLNAVVDRTHVEIIDAIDYDATF